jgi:hypothetical protein
MRLNACMGCSKNKPFCNRNHATIGFQDAGSLSSTAAEIVEPSSDGRGLKITGVPNGPLAIKGKVKVLDADGQPCWRGNNRQVGSGNRQHAGVKEFVLSTHTDVSDAAFWWTQ